jgi:CheY-like chemotaxis protein
MPYADLTILIIDDNPTEIKLLQQAVLHELENVHLEVIINGADIITALKNSHVRKAPDAIILDCDMPIMAGHGFLTALVNHEHWSQIPLFILTNGQSPQLNDRCKRIGLISVKRRPTTPTLYEDFARIVGQVIWDAKHFAEAKASRLGESDVDHLEFPGP